MALHRRFVRNALAAALALAAHQAAAFEVTREFSGLWLDRNILGHGINIDIINGTQGKTAAVVWYTFAANGERLWVTAIGSVNGNTATLNAYEATGGRFPPAFDPTQVQVLPWGSFELTFNTCDRMHIRWIPNARTGLPSGEMNAVRSSDPLGGGCDDN